MRSAPGLPIGDVSRSPSAAAGWDGLPGSTVAIEVATERHDVVARVEGGESLLERTVHASCEVPS